MSKVSYEEEILSIIEELEKSPENALSLVKKLYKEIYSEIGFDKISFFSNPSVLDTLTEIAYKYEKDDKILEVYIRMLVMISERFKVSTQSLYNFLIRHAESKNKWIKFVVASRLAFLPQFDDHAEKWEYILSIPKIPPKKESMRVFRLVIKQRIDEIPDDLKEKVINIISKFITKENLVIDTHNLFLDIIEQLSKSKKD